MVRVKRCLGGGTELLEGGLRCACLGMVGKVKQVSRGSESGSA